MSKQNKSPRPASPTAAGGVKLPESAPNAAEFRKRLVDETTQRATAYGQKRGGIVDRIVKHIAIP